MTLAQIMELALRQLDEDPADIAEFDTLFRAYANEGYHLAVHTYLKPKVKTEIETGSGGECYVGCMNLGWIYEVYDRNGSAVWYGLSMDGEVLSTMMRNQTLTVLHEAPLKPLESIGDVPVLPEFAHSALASYICYRHLASGNMAKQSRSQMFLQQFHTIMREVKPQGSGSITRMKNLYAATDIRRR